jgi:hypothetical protein
VTKRRDIYDGVGHWLHYTRVRAVVGNLSGTDCDDLINERTRTIPGRLQDKGGLVISVHRALFWFTAVGASLTFWIAYHPPMSDLAQHAAQVTIWHDILVGRSKWEGLLYINYFTPYFVGYLGALLLTFVVPVAAAFKIVLSLGYLMTVVICVVFRKQVGGDERLDWLFLPGFFGFACEWGFYTFLIAVPIGLLFIYWAYIYAQRPTIFMGALLCISELVLFFAHGLVFLFASAVGGSFLLFRFTTVRRLFVSAVPYIAAAIICGLYVLLHLSSENVSNQDGLGFEWGWASRLKFLIYPFGVFKADSIFAPISLAMLATPFILGDHLNLRTPAALAPFGFIILTWAFVPSATFTTAHIYERFAVFLLPFYAFAFCAPSKSGGAVVSFSTIRIVGRYWLPILCWVFLGILIERQIAFAAETSEFESVMAEAKPGYRALGLILDPASEATGNLVAYAHFPLWYQAEKGGFVDFNIAGYIPMIVRFRPGAEPAIGVGSRWLAEGFQWDRDSAKIYKYFFVRHTKPLRDDYFPSGSCQPRLVKTTGTWSLYENMNCYSSPA